MPAGEDAHCSGRYPRGREPGAPDSLTLARVRVVRFSLAELSSKQIALLSPERAFSTTPRRPRPHTSVAAAAAAAPDAREPLLTLAKNWSAQSLTEFNR